MGCSHEQFTKSKILFYFFAVDFCLVLTTEKQKTEASVVSGRTSLEPPPHAGHLKLKKLNFQ